MHHCPGPDVGKRLTQVGKGDGPKRRRLIQEQWTLGTLNIGIRDLVFVSQLPKTRVRSSWVGQINTQLKIRNAMEDEGLFFCALASGGNKSAREG